MNIHVYNTYHLIVYINISILIIITPLRLQIYIYIYYEMLFSEINRIKYSL